MIRFLLSSGMLGIISCTSCAHTFDRFLMFGDSLSDEGNLMGKPITTVGGHTWVYYISQKMGFNSRYNGNSSKGGDNYSRGAISTLQSLLSIKTYFDLFPTLNENTLFGIELGANDLLFGIPYKDKTLSIRSLTDKTSEVISEAEGNFKKIIDAVHSAHGKHIFFMYTPSPVYTIKARSDPLMHKYAGDAAKTLNSKIFSVLKYANSLGINVITADTASIYEELYLEHNEMGLPYADVAACKGAFGASDCRQDNPYDGETHVYADAIHPSDASHKIMAQYYYSIFQSPILAESLSANAVYIARANIDSIYSSYLNGSGLFGNIRKSLDQHNKVNYDDIDLSLGYLNKSTEHDTWAVSVNLDHTIGSSSITRYKKESGLITLSNKYSDPERTALLSLGGGYINYPNIYRDIQLAKEKRVEQSSARGFQGYIDAKYIANFYIYHDELQQGPYVELNYQYVHIDPISERSNKSTSMSFKEQNRNYLITSAGWSIIDLNENSTIRPYFDVSIGKDILSAYNKPVYVSINNIPNWFYIPNELTSDYILFKSDLGARIRVSKSLELGAYLQSELSNTGDSSVNFGLSFIKVF